VGFDAVELFLPSAGAISPAELEKKLQDHDLGLSALGTGGGFLKNGWTLCHPDRSVRQKARDFISEMMALGSRFQAPVIIGSMKGSILRGEDRDEASERLISELEKLVENAVELDAQILLEPLNRYETNLVNRLQEGAALLERIGSSRLRLLADLFHMNIEEPSIWLSLRQTHTHLGYIHFVDSNRHAAGFGHIELGELGSVLKEIGYAGFLSAEALPYPDPLAAANKTIETFERLIRLIYLEKHS
jgi:sugar phosphate isomerase/epimerase